MTKEFDPKILTPETKTTTEEKLEPKEPNEPTNEHFDSKEERENNQELETKKDLEDIRATLMREPATTHEAKSGPDRAEKIQRYQDRNLPQYIAEQKPATVTNNILSLVNRLRGFKTDPQELENIPQKGPFLVLSNHFGGESGIQMGLFKDKNVHLVASETLNWQRSGFRNWMLRKLGFLSIRESLQNLDDQQKQELMTRVPVRAQKGYEKVIQREAVGDTATPRKDIQQIVATLVKGDPVVMFPEGLFMYNGKPGLQKGYEGIDVIAREYKRVTGDDLPILPTAITRNGVGDLGQKQIRIGESFTMSQNPGEESNTDWSMRKIAALLPDAEKGYYGTSI